MNTPKPGYAAPLAGKGTSTALGSLLYVVAVVLVIAGVILAVLVGNTYPLVDEFSGEESFNIGLAFGTFVGALVQASMFLALGWIVEHVHKLERAVIPPTVSDQPPPPAAEGPAY